MAERKRALFAVTSSSPRRLGPPETTKRRIDVIPSRLEVRAADRRRRGAEQAEGAADPATDPGPGRRGGHLGSRAAQAQDPPDARPQDGRRTRRRLLGPSVRPYL